MSLSFSSLARLGIIFLLTSLPETFAEQSTPPPSPIDFDRDIRPILAQHCFPCHGFDPSSRQAELRLDVREHVVHPRNGRAAVIDPGARDRSLLYQKIQAQGDERMPPIEREGLQPAEIAKIGRWIDEGANYSPPWAWRPVRNPPLPDCGETSWPRDRIDRFILAKLLENNLTPSDEANRHSWLRRVTFDLIGLPPTPNELHAFLYDTSPNPFERVVERLLASPHFGEQWGRHWLDLMRYAETHGHEFDYPIPDAWRYRDYVVGAFNADVPYADFVREHIAGDLLESPRHDSVTGINASILGTGFWWLAQGTHAPVDVRQDQADRTDNQIDVASKTFLGITVSCARCHDHKFDPILTADYYAFAGFLRSSRRARLHLDPHGQLDRAVNRIVFAQQQLSPYLQKRLDDLSRRPWLRTAQRTVKLLEETRLAQEASRLPTRVLFDFEGQDFKPWLVEGTAFGSRPHQKSELILEQGTGVHGNGVANSHDRRRGTDSAESDQRTGVLTSPLFKIDRPLLEFQIGGGQHPGETCVNLRLGHKVVRTATGRDSTAMASVVWDVREFVDQEVQIEIVDRHQGAWGHISADHFILYDVEPSGFPEQAEVTDVARELQMNPGEFTAWLHAIQSYLEHKSVSRVPVLGDGDLLFADFENPEDFQSWFPEGHAFGKSPLRGGSTLANGDSPQLISSGCAHSGRYGRKFQGTLRSPTFTIERDFVHLRLKGRGQVRVIIDDYYLDTSNPLLFGGMAQSIDRSEWHHVKHDVSRYQGHQAYLEWNDDGDGFLAIDAVWFSDDSEPVSRPAESRLEIVVDTDASSQLELASKLIEHGAPLLEKAPFSALELELLATITTASAEIPLPIRALGMVDATPREERIFIRGAHSQLGEPAPRRLVKSLLPQQAPVLEGSGRLELAERILSPENPLPYRVMANRIWHHLFGRGIVATPDEFGALGTRPTHPDLLDHLATSLEQSRSVKGLIRRIVLSATYRQSTHSDDQSALTVDPENRWYHRRPPRRLTAEEIRDAMLATSGRLDRALGGPPIPIHLTDFLTGRGRPSKSGPLDGAGRRSIYLAVRRNFLSPFLLSFDAPIPFSTIGKRNVSNVPAQSLTRMNDPLVHELAQFWAERILAEDHVSPKKRLESMIEEAYSRPALEGELDRLLLYLSEYSSQSGWQEVAHAILASQEFINLN